MAQTDISLAPGERGLYSISFRPNLILFWLRSTFLVTNRRIAVKYPNTILGIIPLGFEERSIPMGSIAGVNASVRVKAGRLITFVILALLSLFLLQQNIGFLVLTLIFVAFALNAIMASLDITNNGGGITTATVSLLDKAALESFKEKANEYIYSATSAGTSWNEAMHNPQQYAPPQGFGPTANTQFNIGHQMPAPQDPNGFTPVHFGGNMPQQQYQPNMQMPTQQPQQPQWGDPSQQQPTQQWAAPSQQQPQWGDPSQQQPQWGNPSQQPHWGDPSQQQPGVSQWGEPSLQPSSSSQWTDLPDQGPLPESKDAPAGTDSSAPTEETNPNRDQ